MATRYNRSVSVSMSGLGLLIGLIWTEKNEQDESEMKSVFMEYPETRILESVNKALNILACGWGVMHVTNNHMLTSCKVHEGDNELFDFLTNSDEPWQAFISRHVLEYKGGMRAEWRYECERVEKIVNSVSVSAKV